MKSAAAALAAAGIPDGANYADSRWDRCSTIHASGWNPQSESMVFRTHLTSELLTSALSRKLLERGWREDGRTSKYARWLMTLSDGRNATVVLSPGYRDAAGPLEWTFFAMVPAAHHPIPNCV